MRGAHDWRRPVLLRLRHAGREGPGPGCPGVVRALGPCVRLLRGAAREGDLFCMSCGAKVVPATIADAGIGDAELVENAGIGESELAEVDGGGNGAVTPGGEGAPRGEE